MMKKKKWNNKQVKKYYQDCHKKWSRKKDLLWKLRAWPSFLYQRKRLIDTKKEIVKMDLKERVLDAACGDGWLLKFLPKKSVGMEIDPFQADKAQKSASKAIVISGDIEKINYPDHFFKTVLVTEFFEHIPDPKPAIFELWRVLKKKGFFIITVPSKNFLWKIRFLASAMSIDEPQCRLFSKKTILDLFLEYDYKIKKFKKIAFGLNYLLVLEKI